MAQSFFESFDNGIGALSHTWGAHNIDTSVRGQVTVSNTGGLMERPYGPSAGHGYGTYSFTAALHGNAEGSAILLWPGDDKWPGTEYDVVEVINGQPYGTVHYRGSDGGDGYNVVNFNGIDETQVHTYTLDWQPGKISYFVDGNYMGAITEGVKADYAHGGMNETIGLMNRTSEASMTVYDVSYTPMGEKAAEVAVTTPVADVWVAASQDPVVSAAVDTGSSSGTSSGGNGGDWLSAYNVLWNQHDGGGAWEADFWASWV
ncbi:MAG: glycosyl hydrolase family protein [Acetobacteraceae bacterium]|nr:MAG: glycosyl hydrolase family protein [Acetobacteraceae bacterium]